MAAAGTLIGILIILQGVAGQSVNVSLTCNGICSSMHCRNMECLRGLHSCVVILGNLTLSFLGESREGMFRNITFPSLKEITGYMAIYQVPYLDSIGQLFPNLVRIRGQNLLHDYALVIYDMYQLHEIGLYSLLKIDRGGVIIWGGSDTCYVDTINWKTIAPRYRHVLSPADEMAHCNKRCTCSADPSYNYCWNIWKCQRFLDGPEALKCDEQCLGCRLTDSKQCMLCRHYTYNGRCVPNCPRNSVVLEDNQYCITADECSDLGRWVWNNTCVSSCPENYVMRKTIFGLSCMPCVNCSKYCGSIVIRTLSSIQEAHRCVYINGSLIIRIRGLPVTVEEMKINLGSIQEIFDYLVIHHSSSITSIDFLPSLKRIHGRKLFDDKYSLVIRDNERLQTVFLSNVTKNLKIDNGTIGVVYNPMLCVSEIDELTKLFRIKPDTLVDIPPSLNGYDSGGCKEIVLGLKVRDINETSATVTFVPVQDNSTHYSVLYARIPAGKHAIVVPETCSNYDWHAISIPDNTLSGQVELNSLRPASTYLVCIESYDYTEKYLARSSIVNFSTTIGKPEPPFIVELVAYSPDVVVLHWVDHVDYRLHIIRYELDVMLVDIEPDDITASDQCKNIEEALQEIDIIYRHAIVMRPPPDYGKGCESMCGILATVPHGAMVEENFDVCQSLVFGCNEIDEESPVGNTSYGLFVRSASIDINAPMNGFKVGNLAPYRDYRFRLRACTEEKCSRSARSVVRTLSSKEADIPTITAIEADTTGLVKVFWEPPVVYNGAVLAYIIEIMPDTKVSDVGVLWTQTWCVPANQSSKEVNSKKAVGIRLCSFSLASRAGCTEYRELVRPHQSSSWGWAGVIFAIPLCIISLVIGYLWSNCQPQGDSVPLVDITSSYRCDSEPPMFSMLDFTPSLHVPNTE